ncbi:hypothetical protein ZWY2020_057127 [Hordeum vulgare]|nr:hypothetical protein ZWY2020_057127 [Hordeum vulgare]
MQWNNHRDEGHWILRIVASLLAKVAVYSFHVSRGWAPMVLCLAAGFECYATVRDMFDTLSLPLSGRSLLGHVS